MTVAYLSPLTGAPARPGESLLSEAIKSGPAYARTRTMGRWHRVRSAYLRLDEWHDDIREIYQAWCGQSMGNYFRSGPPILLDDPPADEPRCGTCEGRAIGADPEHPEWIFLPRRLQPPRWCPSTHGRHLVDELPEHSVYRIRFPGVCLVCGRLDKMRGGGGPYRGWWGIQKHTPGPGLIPGCEFHGWRDLTLVIADRRRTVTCRCQVAAR